jgi:internalin A
VRWEYIGTGLALIGIGVTLVLALPPPWWSKMSPQLIQAGVLTGVVLVLAGVCILAIGIVPGLPAGKIGPIFLAALGTLFLIASAVWFFLPTNDAQTSRSTVARLAELGWTVKPGQDDTLFEIAGGSLPQMQESATYFEQLNRPFRLHFQSVKNLDGLHYLAGIANCSSVEINAGEFTDISELRGFGHLTKLVISQVPLNGVGVVDASALSSLLNLQELSLGMTRVRSADALASLKSLKFLYLGQTLISDLSALSGLNLIEKLDIRDTRVTDLTPLAGYQNLADLTISGEQVPGLVNLAQLHKLKRLVLIDQRPVDLTPIGTLTNLESIFIWGLPQFDLLPLRNLDRLKDLQLSGIAFGRPLPPVTNVQTIGDLKQLQTLIMGQMQIANLDYAKHLTNLRELNLNQLPIIDIGSLRGLPSLQKISMGDIPVVDISPLLDLPKLTDLSILRVPARADVLKELERRGIRIVAN